jgi:repressor LexA
MAKGLTDRQSEVFNFILNYIDSQGYPPTIREMQEGIGIGSLRGVTIHLDALQKKGVIERFSGKDGPPRQARGIRILAQRIPRSKDADNSFVRLPLLGTIAAGKPLLANQNIEDLVAVPIRLLRNVSDAFLLRVKGDSMTGAHILDGDLVIIHPQDTAENGEIVAARIGEDATVKRFWRHGNKIELQPQNVNYAPIPLRKTDNAAIIGKVIGLLRGY